MAAISNYRLQGINISHPGARDREAGAPSQVWLGISRPSGSIIDVTLTEEELVRLIANASHLLATLYKQRGPS